MTQMPVTKLLVVAAFGLVSGCNGSVPTSPSSAPSSAAPLPESIEIISANVPTGTTIRLVDCSDNWDAYGCFKDLRLTFSVRSNRNAELAIFNVQFLTSDGRVCGESGGETGQPLFAGVAATFRTTDVFLKPDCFDRLPFQATGLLALVSADPTPRVNDGTTPIELMKQELAISYTFVR